MDKKMFICLLLGVLFLLIGCRSIPYNRTMETERTQETQMELYVDTSHTIFAQQSISQQTLVASEENELTETWVWRFDTIGEPNPRIREIVHTRQIKSGSMYTALQVQASMDSIVEDKSSWAYGMESREKELEIQKAEPAKDPYRWRYICVAFICAIALGIYCFLRRRSSG